MSVLGDVLAASTLALTFFLAMVRHRKEFGFWLFAAMLSWAFSLGLVIMAAARGRTYFPSAAHVVWVGAIVLACIGLSKIRETRSNYVGPMLAMDSVMIGSTWMLLAWRVFLWHPELDFGLAEWLMVAFLGFLSNGVAICVLLFANYPTRKLALFMVGSLALAVSQVMAAHDHVVAQSQSFVPGDGHWRLVLAVVGTGMCLAATMSARSFLDRDTSLAREERRRGLVVIPLIGFPVTVLVMWDPGGPLDPVLLVVGAIALVCFLGREYVRQLHNAQLIRRLGELAMRDPLTDIGNRRALADELPLAIQRGRSLCLLSLDIDRFKEINRQLGHAAGDRVLARLGRLLRECGLGAPYRLGGDEFALLVEGSLPVAFTGAERLRAQCQAAFAEMADIESLAITVSIGLARVHKDAMADDPLELLEQSNQALRAAKNERNRVRVYSDEDAAAQEYRDSIEQCLRQALQEHQVAYCYQPIVSMRDGAVTSLELLARWRDPVLGVVSPQRFIPVAEESGLIHELGRQSLLAGIVTARRLAAGGSAVTVGVNVSPVQLRRQSFADELIALLSAHSVPPSRLTIEVTEGIFISLDDPALDMLDRLAALGINIAIDDFGSGYSSLGYLTRLPAGTIKIDRTLTKDVALPRSRSIISALLGVAMAHDLKVVCEGVESLEVATQLRELGADLIQGWLYSPAVPEDQLTGVIESIARNPSRLRRRATDPVVRSDQA